MKKTLSFLTSTALLVSMTALNVSAAETGTDYEISVQNFYNTLYSITATDVDGTSYDANERKNDNLPKYKFYIEDAKEVCITESLPYPNVLQRCFSIKVETTAETVFLTNDFAADIIFNDNGIKIKNNSPDTNSYDIIINDWSVGGLTKKDIQITPVENGMILSGSSGVTAIVDITDSDQQIKVNASADVMVAYDENNSLALYTDPDKDGVYDTAVQKGDANCDGYINASDASAILSLYSLASIGEHSYVNSDIADYNGDGIVNATDASDVLKKYSEISTIG